MNEGECSLAIYRDGRVQGAVACDCKDYAEIIGEWAADPEFRELVRVPVVVARHYLFQQWPGREEAFRALGITA